MHDALGPLAGTLPRMGAVLLCLIVLATAVRVVGRAIGEGRTFLLLTAWATGIAAFVTGGVAFQSFARGGPTIVTAAGLVAFIDLHSVPLAAVLLLGTVAAAGIELTRSSWAPSLAPCAGRPTRAEAIGSIGERLVSSELRQLGWPMLNNVVLVFCGRSVEIDHLVRAPDGIVVIETKTLSGIISARPGGDSWQQNVGGQVNRFLSPLLQNEVHMEAVRAIIADPAVSLRGLVVSVGRARFSEAIAGSVVPLSLLARVLLDSVSVPLFGQQAIDAAWSTLVAEAARSAPRRAAHAAYAQSRKRVRIAWL